MIRPCTHLVGYEAKLRFPPGVCLSLSFFPMTPNPLSLRPKPWEQLLLGALWLTI